VKDYAAASRGDNVPCSSGSIEFSLGGIRFQSQDSTGRQQSEAPCPQIIVCPIHPRSLEKLYYSSLHYSFALPREEK
jgi:hypothetical protein